MNEQDRILLDRDDDRGLYVEIQMAVSSDGKKQAAKFYGGKRVEQLGKAWEGYHFRDFINELVARHKKLENELDKIFSETKKLGSVENFRKMPPMNGITKTHTKIVFEAVSKTLNIRLLECIVLFLEFCEREGKPLRLIELYDDNGKTLRERIIDIRGYLGELDKNENQRVQGISLDKPALSLQDNITLRNEVKRIRDEIGFYPSRKHKCMPFDPKKYSEFVKDIDDLLISAPKDSELLVLKAWSLSQSGKLKEARHICEPLYIRDTNNLNVVISHANILGLCGDIDEAIEVLRTSKSEHPNSPLPPLKIGVYLFNQGRYQEAENEFLDAIEKDEDYIAPYSLLANVYIELKQYKKCEAVLRKVLKKSNHEVILLRKFYEILKGLGKESEAKRILDSIDVDKLSSTEAAYYNAMQVLYDDGIGNAAGILDEHISNLNYDPLKNESEQAEAFRILAGIFGAEFKRSRDVKHKDHAKSYYKKSIDIDPHDVSSLFYYAFFCCIDGDFESCQKLLSEIVGLENYVGVGFSNPCEMYAALSALLHQVENEHYAIPLIWCHEKYPENLLCVSELVHVYCKDGEVERAKKFIQIGLVLAEKVELQDINMVDAGAIFNLCKIALEVGKIDHDIRELREKSLDLLSMCCSDEVKARDIDIWKTALPVMAKEVYAFACEKNHEALYKKAVEANKLLLTTLMLHKDRDFWIEVNNDLIVAYDMLWEVTKNIEYLKEEVKYLNDLYIELDTDNEREDYLDISFDLAHRYMLIGNELSDNSFRKKSESIFSSRHELLCESKDKDLWIESCYFIGLSQLYICKTSSYEESANSEVFERIENNFLGVVKSSKKLYLTVAWHQLGELYLLEGNRIKEKSILLKGYDALNRALKLANKKNDPIQWANIQHNIGNVYQDIGAIEKSWADYKNAISPYQLAIKVYEQYEEFKDIYMLYIFRLGLVFFSVYKFNKKARQSYLNKSIHCFDDVINYFGSNDVHHIMARAYFFNGHAKYMLGKNENNFDMLISARESFDASIALLDAEGELEDANRVLQDLNDLIGYLSTKESDRIS